MKPSFLVLGVGKSGTTSLAHNLDRHPDVFLSVPKEPWFFDGPEYESRSLDWYWNRYYSDWSGEAAAGEASSHNLFVPFVPSRLSSSLSDVRLIAVLRHPVERAQSHWWMNTCHGLEDLSFEEAVDENLERLAEGRRFSGPGGMRRWYEYIRAYQEGTLLYRCYVDMGYYAEQLERYRELFPDSSLRVLLLSDLKDDFAGCLRELWDFLGVDPEAGPAEPVRRNEKYNSRIVYALTRLVTRTKVQYLVPRPIRRWIGGVLRDSGSAPRMRSMTRRRLMAHYEPHNRRLESVLGRNLSHWTTGRMSGESTS